MIGNIIFVNHKKGFLPKAIKFFTKSEVTHCAIDAGNIFGEESTLGAEEIIAILPKEKWQNEEYELIEFKIGLIAESALQNEVRKIYKKYIGMKYGYLQLLWFCYRWFVEKFGIDVRKSGNWFPEDIICSEFLFYYLQRISLYYAPLKYELEKYNGNCISPADCLNIVMLYPHIFRRVRC